MARKFVGTITFDGEGFYELITNTKQKIRVVSNENYQVGDREIVVDNGGVYSIQGLVGDSA